MFGRSHIPRISHQPMVPSYYLGIALVAIVVLVGLLVTLWLAPAIDQKKLIGSKVRPLQQEIERQSEVIATLKKERSGLQLRITKMKHMSQIDRESLSRVQDELKADQNERLKMEEELVFLRSMVSSKAGKGVLHLQRLRLRQGKSENSFLYAFTISKVLKDQKYLEGQIYLALTGKQDGKKLSLPLRRVSRGRQDSVKMKFKHFQNVEGEFLLPVRFKPSGVTIEVRPAGTEFKPVKKSFEWVVIG